MSWYFSFQPHPRFWAELLKKTKFEEFGLSGSSLEFPKDPLLFDFQPRKNAIGQSKIHRPNFVLGYSESDGEVRFD